MRPCLRLGNVLLGLLTLGLLNVGWLPERVAQAQDKSWTDSIKQGFNKVFNPKGSSESDQDNNALKEDRALSLHGDAKPGAKSRVAMAQYYEQANRLADAEQQYQMALNEKSDFLPALLGYAQLQSQLGKSDKALELYQQAAKAYPKDAVVFNNMGMFQAQHKRLNEAAEALKQAAALEPENRLYGNNYASVLVAQGRTREAFEVLRSVHDDATGHYNLGFLLNKKGRREEAMRQFAMALEIDPSMAPAKRWYEFLMQKSNEERLARAATANAQTAGPPQDVPQDAPIALSGPPAAMQEPSNASKMSDAASREAWNRSKTSNIASREPSNTSTMSYVAPQTSTTLPMPPATPQAQAAVAHAVNRTTSGPSIKAQGFATRTQDQSTAPRELRPLPPVPPLTKRLPAADVREPAAVSQLPLAQPNISYDCKPSLVTPLPPMACRSNSVTDTSSGNE